jgi:hypothetical protein
MARNLTVHGPIKIPFGKQRKGSVKHIYTANVKDFWKLRAAKAISAKKGCYIFSLRASRGFTPWYVGKATKSFKREALGAYQLNHYNDVLFDGRKGNPVMFVIAPPANKKAVPVAICNTIETFLIQAAYAENPLIRNRQQTKIPEWTIKGVVRPKPGKPTKLEQSFKKMMGIG